jgi:hypothetical protein
MILIRAGFGTNQRGPKSGQNKLTDLDALGLWLMRGFVVTRLMIFVLPG